MPDVAMIEIIMLETRRGAPTSTTTVLYEAGQTYLVPADLAASFFSCHAADPAEAHATRPEPQEAPPYPQAIVLAPEPKNSRHRPRHGRGKAS
jgi:hypothetical protein